MDFRNFMDRKKQVHRDIRREKSINESKRHSGEKQVQRHGHVEKYANEVDSYEEESKNMLAALNKKLKEICYRYGMSGLEKVDDAIISVCEELINPNSSQISEKEETPKSCKKRKSTQRKVKSSNEQNSFDKKTNSLLEISAAALGEAAPMHEITDYVDKNNDSVSFSMNTQESPVQENYNNLSPEDLNPDVIEEQLNINNEDHGIVMNNNMMNMINSVLQK